MGGDSRLEPSLLYSTKRLELVIRARLDRALRGSGITTLQFTALTVLEHRDGASAAQLARDSFVTPQSMADMLRTLEQRGLIRRVANPASRRELLVHLTDAGHALLRTHSVAVDSIAVAMMHGFDDAEITAFRTALTAAWTNLTEDAGEQQGARHLPS
jgi:DNA-binding MarR family transcriptional regulator